MGIQSIVCPSPSRTGAYSLAFVGSFTTAERKARGQGIDVYRVDPDSGVWMRTDHVADLVNPSFFTVDPARKVLVTVHGDRDYVTVFSVDTENGKLSRLGQAKSGGMNGVYPALDPSGRFLLVANYASSTVAVLPVVADGALGDFVQLLELPGPIGPHRTEQKISHPHHVVFDPAGHFAKMGENHEGQLSLCYSVSAVYRGIINYMDRAARPSRREGEDWPDAWF